MQYFQSAESMYNLFFPLLRGTGITLELFLWTLLFSIPLGFVICSMRMSRVAPVRWFAQGYILIFRGTPLLLQLIFFFLGFSLMGIKMDRMFAAVLAFSLNYAAYFAEIFRGGIQSMPVGQYEAAQVLGLSRGQTFFKVILPQVIKRVFPPVGNEVIVLVKDTALVYVIALSDLLRESEIIMMRDFDLTPLIVAGAFYLVLTTLFTFILNKLEKRMNYYTI